MISNEAQVETGTITVASGVSLEEYLEKYAEAGCEYVEGAVIKVTPIGLIHEELRDFVRLLFQVYFSLKPIGRVLGEPFVMYLPAFPDRRREPDLMVVLNSNPAELKETYLDGPADLCIEIVSPGSVGIDHGIKFQEYEHGRVGEYWIFDPIRSESRFYQLNEQGIYIRQSENSIGDYVTPTLPEFRLPVPLLWTRPLPNPIQIIEMMRNWMKE